MSRLDDFLLEHRAVPGCGHGEDEAGHNPRVRALYRAYVDWCEANEYLMLSEDAFVPSLVVAGYEKYEARDGRHFRGLTLDTAVEHAGGAPDPEAYWATMAEHRRAEREAKLAAEAEREAARVQAAREAAEYGKAMDWWQGGMAYRHLAGGYSLPPEVERYRGLFFRPERLDVALRDDFIRVHADRAKFAARRAFDGLWTEDMVRAWPGADVRSLPDDRLQAESDAMALARALAADEWDREHPTEVIGIREAGLAVSGGMADYVDPCLSRYNERCRRRVFYEALRLARERRLGINPRTGQTSHWHLTKDEQAALEAEATTTVAPLVEPFEHEDQCALTRDVVMVSWNDQDPISGGIAELMARAHGETDQ